MGFLFSGLFLTIYNGFIYEDFTGFNKPYTIDELKVVAKKENLYLYTRDELDALLKEYENNCNGQGENTTEENNIKGVYFAIPKGFSSDEVADYLLEVGVLKDKEEFLKILEKESLATKIIAKTYYYDHDLSTEELIELITNTDRANW